MRGPPYRRASSALVPVRVPSVSDVADEVQAGALADLAQVVRDLLQRRVRRPPVPQQLLVPSRVRALEDRPSEQARVFDPQVVVPGLGVLLEVSGGPPSDPAFFRARECRPFGAGQRQFHDEVPELLCGAMPDKREESVEERVLERRVHSDGGHDRVRESASLVVLVTASLRLTRQQEREGADVVEGPPVRHTDPHGQYSGGVVR